MEINGTQAQAAAASQANQASTGLAENFETFLSLLTTQLQHQDPLEPLDSKEFTDQLVQFTQVEQSIASNKNLEKLIDLTALSGFNAAVNYLGKEISAPGAVALLENGEATWTYALQAGAEETALTVRDQTGKIVYTADGATTAGDHAFTWNGKDDAGNPLPDGIYALGVEATTAEGNAIATSTTIRGRVESVEIIDGEPIFSVNGLGIPLSEILSVSEPASEDI